jgi:tetratricopeptide (TPR) repeat protein
MAISTTAAGFVSATILALSLTGSADQVSRTAPTAAAAAPSGAAAAAALRAEGIALGYNLDRVEALAVFKKAIAADPGDPAGHRMVAANAWIALLFEQGAITVDDYLGEARANLQRDAPNPVLAKTFHDAITQAMTLSEARLRAQPNDADAHYQVGAAYGFLASYTATVEGRLSGSFSPARRAYREHERALALAPTRKDAGLIVGMYRYAVSELALPLRLAAMLAGMGSGKERGLRMVEEAARFASDVQPNALFTLVLLYNREQRYDDALRVIGDLQRRFPRNRLLWLEAGGTALRAGQPALARVAIEEGLTRLAHDDRPRAPGEEARWHYTYGAVLAALKESAPAERELNTALARATRDWVRGRIHKELGKLADSAGNRTRALEELALAERFCRQDHDTACADEAKALAKGVKRKSP